MIFDTHVHYDDRRFDPDRDELLKGLAAQGVGGFVNVGAGLESSRRSCRLALDYDFAWASVGIHPDELQEAEALGEIRTLEQLTGLLQSQKVVAVGEIGLDYYDRDGTIPDKVPKELQKKWFALQLELAVQQKLPVILHSRDAAADTLQIVRQKARGRCGVMHCFSYEKEMASEYLKLGWYIGVGGVVTFKNGRKLKDVVQYIPLESILLETDGPYLAPEPWRGQRNSSEKLSAVVREIARLKGLETEEVEAATWENACRFYRLKP